MNRLILWVFCLAIFSLGASIFSHSALANDCEPGRYKKAGKCVRADAGHYVQAGMTKQAQCPPGTYNETRGATECTPCPKGHFNSRSASSSASHCVKAWAGYYVPTTGAAAQTKCSPGTFTTGEGRDKCRLCPLGTYTGYEGQEGCIDADLGHYVDKAGQAAQTPCPANTRRNAKNGKSAADCKACDTDHGSLPGSHMCTHITSPHLYFKFHGVGAKNTKGDNPDKCKKGTNWKTSKQKCT